MVALDPEVARRALSAARAVSREGVLRAVFVFGSHAQGRADEWSDIDVAAFVDGVETWDLWRRTAVITRVQKEVGFDVEPHLFPASSLDAPEPGSFAAYVLSHGIRVEPHDPRPES
jgi:predicted nucleotidyltransferase